MKRLARILGTAAVLAVVVFTLRDRLPQPGDMLTALRDAEPRWLIVAAVAEFISMAMFGRQQRRLLIAFGVTMPRRRALALSYSRSAISISLPAGSAVSAGYAFRQFRAGGASRVAATTVMVLSGLLSMLGLVLLYTTGALAAVWHTHPVLITLGAAAVLLGGIVWLLRGRHSPRTHAMPRSRLLRPLAEAVQAAHSVAPRHWTLALGAAVLNWLTDLVCLIAAARGFGIEVGLLQLATIYLAVQIVRQVPLTPGGIGVIEVSLLTGLVSAGAADTAGAAAVLVYRMLSCWLIIPVGLVCWLLLRAGSKVVSGALLDEHGTGELGTGLGEDGAAVTPRGDVREQEPPHARTPREFAGLPAGEVHAIGSFRGIGPAGLAQQDVGAAGQLVQSRARPGVPGISERPVTVAHP